MKAICLVVLYGPEKIQHHGYHLKSDAHEAAQRHCDLGGGRSAEIYQLVAKCEPTPTTKWIFPDED